MHPLDPAPRTAILVPGFRTEKNTRVFENGWNVEAERFAPAVVAGTMVQLRELAASGVGISHAVVVFGSDPLERLADRDRDFIWEAFGVPVFEQYLDERRNLLAHECDAHDGLHAEKAPAGAELDRTPCACGSEVPKLVPARAPTRMPVASAAKAKAAAASAA